ncbi:MAG: sigma-70 family RNA polymerase sigma factor [Planctomycetes bacterium]|jgi:RNA polymerase sigma factor (sigma-70 family)|nr:sigma-70 family RNA polymerase sigma factor [Planctomycetota bacterium]
MDQSPPDHITAHGSEPAPISLDWHTLTPSLLRAARRRLSRRLLCYTTPEDVVQEAIVGILACARYRKLPAPAQVAVLRCSVKHMPCQVHRSVNRQRRCISREVGSSAYPVEELMDPKPATDELAAHAEMRAMLTVSIRALRPADARILGMRLDGHSLPEIGRALGLQAEAARKRATRAMDRLRTSLVPLRSGWGPQGR